MTKDAPRDTKPSRKARVQKLRSASHRSRAQQRQHLSEPGALLGVAVRAREGVRDQPQGRLVDHQGLARQGGGGIVPGLVQPVLGGGQVVAVEDAGAVAWQPRGRGAAQLLHDRGQAAGGVAH